jgi:hypothetical protein
MNDPHVERLRYRLNVNPIQLSFESPPPLFQEYDAFRIRLENGTVTVEMKEHHASVKSAKEKVEGFIRDWMIYAAFDFDWNLLKFEYEDAEVIDRNPSPRVPGQITGDVNITLPMPTCKGTGMVHPIKLSEYPAPPTRFRATPDVETMWFRYQQHLQDKETYQSLGYFCLSLMQWSTGLGKGARGAASRMYNIDRDILDKLGELTSKRGTQRDARKLDSGSTLISLTDVERRWIREALKMLIRRKGEYDFDPATAASLKQITIADLPKL